MVNAGIASYAEIAQNKSVKPIFAYLVGGCGNLYAVNYDILHTRLDME